MKVYIKRINGNTNPLPFYATPESAGMDFYARLDETLVLEPGCRVIIPLGVAMAIPSGYELQLRPRSGLAIKNGITLLNSPGTIDSDYRDEIGAIVVNHGSMPFSIEKGMKICQGVFSAFTKADYAEVEDLNETERKGGFGSTGI